MSYCILEGVKRLKAKGVKPSKAMKIARKTYRRVKKSWETSGKNQQKGQ